MTSKIKQIEKNVFRHSLATIAQNYVSAGVVCHALVLLKRFNLLDKIESSKYLELDTIKCKKPKKLIIKKAFKELETNGDFHRTDDRYYLTEFGIELIKYIGLMFYIYDGYSNIFSNYFSPRFQQLTKKETLSLVNDEAIVLGSDSLAQNFIDPFIISHLLELDSHKGTICDLGCGDASRLNLISQMTNLNALGIDRSKDAIRLAEKVIKDSENIRIVKDDISCLKKIYPEVTILMQTMVMHDLIPSSKCLKVLNSFLDSFPNLEYFFYCDIVAPSGQIKSQLPGFDYIHAMLGIETRTYHETVRIFELSNFEIISEHMIENLSNTILWVLKPKEKLKKIK